MFRFKLSAFLLSLVSRLGLSEPQYSILDESSSNWLPDDCLLTGLNTLYNSLFQGIEDNCNKKKRPVSAIAAAIVEYLSTDLAEEQSKLNSELNTRTITTKSQKEYDFASNKKTFDEKLTRTSDFYEKLDFRGIAEYNVDIKIYKYYDLTTEDILDNEIIQIVDNNNNQQSKCDHRQILRLTEVGEIIINL